MHTSGRPPPAAGGGNWYRKQNVAFYELSRSILGGQDWRAEEGVPDLITIGLCRRPLLTDAETATRLRARFKTPFRDKRETTFPRISRDHGPRIYPISRQSCNITPSPIYTYTYIYVYVYIHTSISYRCRLHPPMSEPCYLPA